MNTPNYNFNDPEHVAALQSEINDLLKQLPPEQEKFELDMLQKSLDTLLQNAADSYEARLDLVAARLRLLVKKSKR